MDLPGDSWFGLAGRKMDWAAARQRAIAENIANADTPGHVGRDVVSFEDHLSQASARGSVQTEEATASWGGSFDGNRVVLEEQMVLSNGAASDYQLAARLYRKGHDMIGLAVAGK